MKVSSVWMHRLTCVAITKAIMNLIKRASGETESLRVLPSRFPLVAVASAHITQAKMAFGAQNQLGGLPCYPILNAIAFAFDIFATALDLREPDRREGARESRQELRARHLVLHRIARMPFIASARSVATGKGGH